jgi:hypothetical protein
MHKKEAAAVKREMSRMARNFEGLLEYRDLPAAMIVVDTKLEEIAVNEAVRLGIPMIGLSTRTPTRPSSSSPSRAMTTPPSPSDWSSKPSPRPSPGTVNPRKVVSRTARPSPGLPSGRG